MAPYSTAARRRQRCFCSPLVLTLSYGIKTRTLQGKLCGFEFFVTCLRSGKQISRLSGFFCAAIMIVFWKERLVFLSVPKTGTSAYAEALAPRAGLIVQDPPELKHAPIYRYNGFFRPMFEKMGAEDMEIMAVVREPVSWLGSWYRYRQRSFLDGKPTSTKGVSFDAFVEAYCQSEKPAFANVGSQAKFVEPRPNGVRVTHLFAYENQTMILGFLEDRLETKIDLLEVNVSPRMPLELSPQTRHRLERRCSAEFEIWSSAIA